MQDWCRECGTMTDLAKEDWIPAADLEVCRCPVCSNNNYRSTEGLYRKLRGCVPRQQAFDTAAQVLAEIESELGTAMAPWGPDEQGKVVLIIAQNIEEDLWLLWNT